VALSLSAFLAVVICAFGEAAIGEQAKSAVIAAEQEGKYGETAFSREKAVQKAREMFPELLEGKDVNIELDGLPTGQIWRLEWDAGSVGGRRGVEHFSMMLDAETGALLNVYFSLGTGDIESGASPVTQEAARQKAEEFAKKYRPAEFASVRPVDGYDFYYQPGRMRETYDFSWERVENGIPVDGDGIQVAVDALSGNVVRFSASWHDDAVFPEPDSLPEGLERKVVKELGLMLNYQMAEGREPGPSGVLEASLVYQLNSPSFLRIDPSSGDALNPFGKKIPLGQYKLFPSLSVPAAGGSATGMPGAADRPAQKISQAEAQKTAREFFKKIGFEGEVTYSGGGSSDDGIFVDEEWSFTLKDEESWKTVRPRRHRSVRIDTRTGEVKSYYDSDYFEYAGTGSGTGSAGQVVTRDVARAKAMEFIRLVHPEKLGQVIEEQEHYEYSYPGSKERHCFNFVRLVNGIPFTRDGIRITVSDGGEIVSYNCDWHTVQFPDTTGVITREEAERIFQENITLKPLYFFLQEEDKPWPGKRPVLSLAFDGYWSKGIDARTGQPLVMDWQKIRTEKKVTSMVPQEHWAATSLTFLAGSGLLPEEGFDPDGPVSRKDAVRVLMSANVKTYHSPGEDGEASSFGDIAPNDRDYAAIRAAEQMGILEGGGHFSPEQPVTRETLAIWLVRALGYKEIANMPVKIELKMADAELVNENSRNYVAIACGLGLMQGDENGLFRPADQVTWAELAVLVTKAAPRLRAARW